MLERAYPERRIRTPLAQEQRAQYLERLTRAVLLANRSTNVTDASTDLQALLSHSDWVIAVSAYEDQQVPKGWVRRWCFDVDAYHSKDPKNKWRTRFAVRLRH
jgi:hypothetical protein